MVSVQEPGTLRHENFGVPGPSLGLLGQEPDWERVVGYIVQKHAFAATAEWVPWSPTVPGEHANDAWVA
jgi:hypothetical protein